MDSGFQATMLTESQSVDNILFILGRFIVAIKILIISSLFLIQTAVAQTVDETNFKPLKRIAVFADASAFLLKGSGLKAAYSITPNFAVGAMLSKYELGSSSSMNDGVFDPKNKVTAYGVVGTYFIDSSNVAGWYGSLAFTKHKVDTTVNGSLVNGAKAEDEQSGLQVKGGYQFLGQVASNFDLLFQLGLGYGAGGSIKTSADNFTNTAKTELRSSIVLDLSVGTHF